MKKNVPGTFERNSFEKLIPLKVLFLGSFSETEGEGTELHSLLPGNLRRNYSTCKSKANKSLSLILMTVFNRTG